MYSGMTAGIADLNRSRHSTGCSSSSTINPGSASALPCVSFVVLPRCRETAAKVCGARRPYFIDHLDDSL
jgi:hypothetical protein